MRYFVVVASTLAVASAAVGLSNIQHDPEVVQGVIDTLYKIYAKLVELGAEVVCGQTLSELIDLLGLPDTLDSLVATARGWMCN